MHSSNGKKYIVGLTGGLGSGKSTVARIFEWLRVPVFYADAVAAHLMNSDAQLIVAITALCGHDIYTDGKLNRRMLAELAFANKELLTQINGLVHPAVQRAFATFVAEATAPYVMKEAAILYESGSYKDCDSIVTVYADEATRMQRVRARDHRTEEQIRNIMANQMDEQEKMLRSQFVIYNDGRDMVIPQVLSIHRQLLKSAQT